MLRAVVSALKTAGQLIKAVVTKVRHLFEWLGSPEGREVVAVIIMAFQFYDDILFDLLDVLADLFTYLIKEPPTWVT